MVCKAFYIYIYFYVGYLLDSSVCRLEKIIVPCCFVNMSVIILLERLFILFLYLPDWPLCITSSHHITFSPTLEAASETFIFPYQTFAYSHIFFFEITHTNNEDKFILETRQKKAENSITLFYCKSIVLYIRTHANEILFTLNISSIFLIFLNWNFYKNHSFRSLLIICFI